MFGKKRDAQRTIFISCCPIFINDADAIQAGSREIETIKR
jgi:hypothetical protein